MQRRHPHVPRVRVTNVGERTAEAQLQERARARAVLAVVFLAAGAGRGARLSEGAEGRLDPLGEVVRRGGGLGVE